MVDEPSAPLSVAPQLRAAAEVKEDPNLLRPFEDAWGTHG